MADAPKVQLARYDNSNYDPGAGAVKRSIWFLVNALFIHTKLHPSSGLRVALLRLFGAKIGQGVVIKPGVNVKYPWRLVIGDHVWIGEDAWLDSIVTITVGSNCCISQGAYLCTGNHDWTDPAFGLRLASITLEDGVWVGAKALVGPGVIMRSHSIAAAGSVISKDTQAYGIYRGNPAEKVGERKIRPDA
ncbi:MAG: colanic acid biosynthesis acetyltransferase WcaF [Planctomycetes bacterium]|nr:colanic acid biosynthesis acetyltransferase WcaF [Planctomycetota bacterium]